MYTNLVKRYINDNILSKYFMVGDGPYDLWKISHYKKGGFPLAAERILYNYKLISIIKGLEQDFSEEVVILETDKDKFIYKTKDIPLHEELERSLGTYLLQKNKPIYTFTFKE